MKAGFLNDLVHINGRLGGSQILIDCLQLYVTVFNLSWCTAGNVKHLTTLSAGVNLGSHRNSGKKYKGEAQSSCALNLP